MWKRQTETSRASKVTNTKAASSDTENRLVEAKRAGWGRDEEFRISRCKLLSTGRMDTPQGPTV